MRVSTIALFALRFVFGGLLVFAGINKLVPLAPPPPLPPTAEAVFTGFIATGYLFPAIAIVEIVGGALVMANRFVPLALLLLAPIIVNILLFSVFVVPNTPLALFMVATEAGLAWLHRDAFVSVLQATPRAEAPAAARVARGSAVTAS